jgi:hypothetical protein
MNGLIKKFILPFIIVLSIAVPTVVSAYGYSSSWSSSGGSYSPYKGYANTASSSDSYGDYITAKAYGIYYSSSAITAIKNYYYNNTYYHGIDITALDDTASDIGATGWYSTNYPNPKFDSDDDGANGPDEETEIVTLSPTNMTTGTSYYFYSKFKESTTCTYCNPGRSETGYIAITAHESNKSWTGEYNTQYFDELTRVYYKTNE